MGSSVHSQHSGPVSFGRRKEYGKARGLRFFPSSHTYNGSIWNLLEVEDQIFSKAKITNPKTVT